jgi:hypothetical protein
VRRCFLPILIAIALTGCGTVETATTVPPKAETKLPPEVEFDPVTAEKHYQAAGKKPARR